MSRISTLTVVEQLCFNCPQADCIVSQKKCLIMQTTGTNPTDRRIVDRQRNQVWKQNQSLPETVWMQLGRA